MPASSEQSLCGGSETRSLPNQALMLRVRSSQRVRRAGTARRHINRKAALNEFCRSFDHENLFVVDASFFPSSAAVNPALTTAAQAIRVADHIAKVDFGVT
jgi:choline dehydrogenase-like flavoprotein